MTTAQATARENKNINNFLRRLGVVGVIRKIFCTLAGEIRNE